MTIEKGITAKLEDWFAATLAALTYEGEAVFKTAEAWVHQFEAGAESFVRFAPFAFVSYWPADPTREGDYDLCQILRFSILIGVTSSAAGVARRGDAHNVGASKIRDLVIAALDGSNPGGTYKVDDFDFTGETELVDKPKLYATELHFACSFV